MASTGRKRGVLAAAPAPIPRNVGKRPSIPLTISRPELIVNGSDRDFRELVHNLFAFSALHERIRAGHARFIGLSGIDYTVLISIAHLALEGPVNVKTVAEHLHFSGAFITTTTRRLVQRGLIHKTVDSDDRRRVTLTISTKGRSALEKLAPVQRRINDVEFGALDRNDFRTLNDLIKRMIGSGTQAVALQEYLSRSANE